MKKSVRTNTVNRFELAPYGCRDINDIPVDLTKRELKTIKGAFEQMALAQQIIEKRIAAEKAKGK